MFRRENAFAVRNLPTLAGSAALAGSGVPREARGHTGQPRDARQDLRDDEGRAAAAEAKCVEISRTK